MPIEPSGYHHRCPVGTPHAVEPRHVQWFEPGAIVSRRGWYIEGSWVKYCPQCGEELKEPK